MHVGTESDLKKHWKETHHKHTKVRVCLGHAKAPRLCGICDSREKLLEVDGVDEREQAIEESNELHWREV